MVVNVTDIRLLQEEILFKVTFQDGTTYNCHTNRYSMHTKIKGKENLVYSKNIEPRDRIEKFCILKIGQSLATMLKNGCRLVKSKPYDIDCSRL